MPLPGEGISVELIFLTGSGIIIILTINKQHHGYLLLEG
jgi:hypothetical protein